jgi:hypothetical protein
VKFQKVTAPFAKGTVTFICKDVIATARWSSAKHIETNRPKQSPANNDKQRVPNKIVLCLFHHYGEHWLFGCLVCHALIISKRDGRFTGGHGSKAPYISGA